MEPIKISSCEDFEEFCFRTFECFLQGDLFPYSLRDTYHLAFSSWDEAVKELLEDGVEGFTYQKSQDGDDYQLCMQAFVHHVLLQDKELRYLACFCNNTYKMLVNTFDIPLRYDTQCVKGDDGRMKIIQLPVNGYQPKMQDPRYSGFMEANGDIVAKVCFDKFLQRSGFSESTAAIAEAFGMRVVYYSTSGTSHCKDYPSLPLDELMSISDVISVHAPLNERTDGLIGAAELDRMKKTAIIINMGRGGIVNEADLADAIDRDAIGGAALDVFVKEPLPADSPLLHTAHPEKLRFTPHTAWASIEARQRLADMIADNIAKGL